MLLQVEWQREQLATLHKRVEKDRHDEEEVKESVSGGSQGLVYSGEWL